MKNRLVVSTPLGSFQSRQWEEAKQLLAALRTHPQISSLPNRVELQWQILDRLHGEMTATKYNTNSHCLPFHILRGVLLSWRDSVFSISSGEKHNRHTSANNNTLTVLHKVERYMNDALFEPSPMPYNLILHVLAKVEDPQQAPFRGQEIVKSMLERSHFNPNNTFHHPDNVTIYGLAELWARSGLPESPQRVEELLQQLQGWRDETKDSKRFPITSNILCAVMEAHGKASDPTVAYQRIQELVQQLKALRPQDDAQDSTHYNRACHALVTCRHDQGLEAARTILDEMCRAVLEGGGCNNTSRRIKPTQHTFSIFIAAYGRAGRLREAQALLDYMGQMAEEAGDSSLIPGIVCHSSLIWAYARAGEAKQAEAVMIRMMNANRKDHGKGRQQPGFSTQDMDAWNGVLASWADSGDVDAAKNIAKIIDNLQKQSQSAGGIAGSVMLSSSTYNRLLGCYTRQNDLSAAEELHGWMLEQSDNSTARPDSQSYLSMIIGSADAGNAEASEMWLNRLCDQIQEGALPFSIDQECFNVVIGAWSKSVNPAAAERATAVFQRMVAIGIDPDVVSYSSLIWAWARSKSRHSVQTTLDLLQRMLQEWETGNTSVKPNHVTFNGVLWAMLHSGVDGDLAKASTIVRQMEALGIKKTAAIYTTLMNLELKRCRPDRVEFVIEEMKSAFEAGDSSLEPFARNVFVTHLQAWSKAGNPEKTESVLSEWIVNERAPKPTTQDFNAVLQAWLRSKRPNAAEKAEAGLAQMKQMVESHGFDCRPDLYSFTTVISCYAQSDNPECGHIAYSLLREVLEHETARADMKPNLVTYAETLVALCRTRMDIRRAENAAAHILRALRSKDFMLLSDGNKRLLGKVESSLSKSPFPQKDGFLDQLNLKKEAAKKMAEHRNEDHRDA